MSNAIEAHELSKRYRIGQMQAAYGTLRDSLARTSARLTGREQRQQDSQELWALRDVSFRVRAGETVAVVGPTGSGKSTLVSLIARVHDVTGGEILLDGVPVTRFDPTELRRVIGMVPQDPFLFSETIEEKVARKQSSFVSKWS